MITSTANSQVKYMIQLQKKAKARRKERVFVVEGTKMALEAPRDWLQAMYVSQSYLERPEHASQLQGYSYEIVSDSVMEAISDTQTPQGILCLIKMPEYDLEDLMSGEVPLLLVLESIQDPGNLGTMLRTGEGAGINGVIMNRDTVDIFNPKVIRSTMGSLYRMPFYISEDLQETVGRLKAGGIRCYGAHLQGSVPYDQPDYRSGTAFFIGNEGNGLTEELSVLADGYIRIPMEGQVESLNAAVAAALLMYEAKRQR